MCVFTLYLLPASSTSSPFHGAIQLTPRVRSPTYPRKKLFWQQLCIAMQVPHSLAIAPA